MEERETILPDEMFMYTTKKMEIKIGNKTILKFDYGLEKLSLKVKYSVKKNFLEKLMLWHEQFGFNKIL